MNGLHALTKEVPQISLPLPLCEDTRQVGHPKSTLIPPHRRPDPTPSLQRCERLISVVLGYRVYAKNGLRHRL